MRATTRPSSWAAPQAHDAPRGLGRFGPTRYQLSVPGQPIALPAARFVVVKPAAGIDTRRIFLAPDLERATPAAILSGFAAGRIDQTYGFGHNDLQPVAQRLCPEVSEAIRWLRSQGFDARMTGSGSAVFAPMNAVDGPLDSDMPQDAESAIPHEGWQVRRCGNLDVHPLAGWAD